MAKLSLKDLPLKGKKVLMRVDFNVPIQEKKITDEMRIVEALPSIRYVLSQGGSLILISHLGRPKGKDLNLSLRPVAERLSQLLGKEVDFIPDCRGKVVEESVGRMREGDVLLLENLRFYPEEEKPEKNPQFAQSFAKLADYYVDDAFGCAHRAHSSIVKVAESFPKGTRAIGLLMEKEVQILNEVLKNPQKPVFALIGGAKVSTKIGVLLSLIECVDAIFLAGGMVYTFMRAQNIPCGLSLVEEDQVDKALELMQVCKEKGIPLHFPEDIVVADRIASDAEIETVAFSIGMKVPFQGVDMGPKTIAAYTKALAQAKTILWNGPVGVFEVPPFDKGTTAIANALAQLDAKVVVGGGDSVAAVIKAGLKEKFTHLSTGGGASLEFIEFGTLPGIEVVDDLLPTKVV